MTGSLTPGNLLMKKILSACAIAAAFVAMPASAQWYVGAGVGSSKVTGLDGPIVSNGTTVGTFSGGNSNKGFYKVYGGYQITPSWGVEAQYSDLGNRDVAARTLGGVTVLAGSAKASQYSIAGTGTLPLSAGFSLLGKLGVTNNKSKINLPGIAGDENNSSLLVGVGVAYAITPAMSVRFEYEDFGKLSKDDFFGGAVRANAYSVSLKYAF
jgi:OmpA-OmpF porin, OOP family